MTSRKCPDREASARHRRCVASRVVAPMRAAKTGSSGTVSTTMSALGQSTTPSVRMARGGTTAAVTQGRQVAGDVGLDAAGALGRQRDRVRRGGPAVGVGPEPGGEQTLAQRRADPATGPGGDALGGPGQGGPDREHAGEPRTRPAHRHTLDNRHHDGGEGEGGRDRGHALQHADDGEGRNRPARGRGRAQELGVERSHQWCTAAGSDAAGMCWVPIRLRKTQ